MATGGRAAGMQEEAAPHPLVWRLLAGRREPRSSGPGGPPRQAHLPGPLPLLGSLGALPGQQTWKSAPAGIWGRVIEAILHPEPLISDPGHLPQAPWYQCHAICQGTPILKQSQLEGSPSEWPWSGLWPGLPEPASPSGRCENSACLTGSPEGLMSHNCHHCSPLTPPGRVGHKAPAHPFASSNLAPTLGGLHHRVLTLHFQRSRQRPTEGP